jgi:hypothetical protein
MAQVIFNYNPEYTSEEALQELCGPTGRIALTVYNAHYGPKPDGEPLAPGDITLAVHRTNRSDSALFITEGSENWPRSESGILLPKVKMQEALAQRALQISETTEIPANRIIESNGIYTPMAMQWPAGDIIEVWARKFTWRYNTERENK